MTKNTIIILLFTLLCIINLSSSTLIFCKENEIESTDLKSYRKPYCCLKDKCRDTLFSNRIFKTEMQKFGLGQDIFPESDPRKQYDPKSCGDSVVTKTFLDSDITIEDYIEMFREPHNIISMAPDTHFRRLYDCSGAPALCEVYHKSNLITSDHIIVQCTTNKVDFINKVYSIRDGYLVIDSKIGDSLSYPKSKEIKYSRIMKQILDDKCKDSYDYKKLFSKFNEVIKKLKPKEKTEMIEKNDKSLNPSVNSNNDKINTDNDFVRICDNQGMLEELIIKTMSDRDMCGKLALNNQKPTTDEKKLNDFLSISFGVSSIIKGLPVAGNVANIITGVSRIVIGISNLIEDYYEKPESSSDLSDNVSIELMDQIISFNYNLRQTCHQPVTVNIPVLPDKKDTKSTSMETPRMVANTILELFKYVQSK